MFDLPYLFNDAESVVKFLQSDIGQEVQNVVEAKGYKNLAMWPTGFKWMTANRPIKSAADLQGLKVRVMASDVLINQYKAWNASATPLPLPALYNALSQGTVDAQDNTFGMIYDARLYEPQKYLIKSEHSLTMDVFLVNKRWFDSLPLKIQTIMLEEAQKITDQRWRWEEDRNAQLLEKVKELGKNEILTLSKEARKELKKMAQPAYDDFAKKNPSLKPVLDEIEKNYN
jgi:C4-dicarboxylate-binding protein DctP